LERANVVLADVSASLREGGRPSLRQGRATVAPAGVSASAMSPLA